MNLFSKYASERILALHLRAANGQAHRRKWSAAELPSGAAPFPLPMTGEVPAKLKALVMQPPRKPEAIYRHQMETDRTVLREIGRGFCVHSSLSFNVGPETVHNWDERWFILQSRTYARTQAKALMARLKKAQTELGRLKPKKNVCSAFRNP